MLFKPTSGNAYICGHSIGDARARDDIQACLGVCPQFDILYPTMSIREHLIFYARIKGTPQSLLMEHVEDLLSSVEL